MPEIKSHCYKKKLQVDDESSKLLTDNSWDFPFGILAATELYQREMNRLLEGVPVEIIVNDFLVHGKDQTDIDQKLTAVLDKSTEVGLKFNPKKVKLRVPE